MSSIDEDKAVSFEEAMMRKKESENAVKCSVEKSLNNDIPSELKPFFESMIPCHDREWVFEIYHSLIVPYVDGFIKNELLKTQHIPLEDLKILKALFIKNVKDFEIHNKEFFLRCKNRIQIIDHLAWNFENQFFKSIWNQNTQINFRTFLPNNFKELLRTIVKIRILLLMRDEISFLEKLQERNSETIALQQWVSRELLIRSSSFSSKNVDLKEQTYDFKPNEMYYFLNGTHRVFIFCQLELKKIKNIFYVWYDLSLSINYENLSVIYLAFRLFLSSLKFIFDLLYITLLPYRMLRTLVNEISQASVVKINHFLLEKVPSLSNSSNWIILHFIFQSTIYLSLILSFGLPILPLPLNWIPAAFISPYLPIVALIYITSIIVINMGKSLFSNSPKEDSCHYKEKKAHEYGLIKKEQKPDLLDNKEYLIRRPMYDTFHVKKLTDHSQRKLLPANIKNNLRKLSK